MTTWNKSYLKVNESLHIVPLKIVEIIQTSPTGPLDIVLVCKKLGHSSSTWIIYNYTYLWCQSPRQFDFCSLILFLKYVPKMIWIRKVTYRLPIIHVDSNFERHCETANRPLRFSMPLLTVLNSYNYMHICVQIQICVHVSAFLHLCDRCRCDHIEDGATESETFWGKSVMIFL